ncbi:MAG: bifunctional 4-hydroxy-2-oxoglutarate aldolase/2-dehydro-3-deoxy-phosphogluconate aldolase [Defluviitaleaceae bacterium]|nr:bifunctional 4-hydroxy-2-oxoglutarate aldolase/2-dehydro-3-deoxy-phosphogluconate aldolase [Defluviitaleaceae bacterium]MCL2262218.1 bifunctional 4-hydroxy-2-oxoglutarate aldolase/2-dehydro-3-deoxy-phosphogluconate aldolase [Defluviitaleaceae bacterium]
MHTIFEKLSEMRIVPVIVIEDAAKAVPLAKALCEGGLPCAEVTFRTAAAADAISEMVRAFPQMLVGAGTILSPQQADEAAKAGAKFMVSPGLNPLTVRHCTEKGIPMLPGVCTPSEVEQGLSLGLDVLKFFPAEAAGGVNMLKALSGPYRNINFVPTGGIGAANLREYLALKNVIACGGSWMVSGELIESGDFAKITELTREAAALAK